MSLVCWLRFIVFDTFILLSCTLCSTRTYLHIAIAIQLREKVRETLYVIGTLIKGIPASYFKGTVLRDRFQKC
jgi:hypothetical protein